jgi:hypothetical protein
MDPAGKRLKIPLWMLLPECAEIKISAQPYLSKQALLSLASPIASHLDSKHPVHDNLLQPAVNGCEGERRPASISGPDDPKRMHSKGSRLDMPATPRVRLCFVPIDGSVKRFNSCSRSFENCGVRVRHSNGSEITTLSCRPTPSRERGWSGRFRRRA